MSDQAALFAILCLIYLSDCLLWVDSHGLAFVTRSGKKWLDRRPGVLTLASRGGILFLNPFPPLGKVLSGQVLPLSISPLGVCSAACQSPALEGAFDRSPHSKKFDAIRKVTVSDKWLLVNDERFQSFSGRAQAASVCALLNKLRKATENKRGRIIEQFLETRFKMTTAKARLNRCMAKMASLTFLSNALFIYLFILSPALMVIFQQTELLIWIALGMFVIAIQITLGYYQLHKSLYPESAGERVGNMIKMLICPPVSIRVCDLVTRNLLVSYHPLLIARLLFADRQFEIFAGKWLRQITYAGADQPAGKTGGTIVKWYHETLIRLASDHLGLKEHLQNAMLGAPAPDDSDVRTYCPRCHSQFLLDGGHCPDCHGVELVRFDHLDAINHANG